MARQKNQLASKTILFNLFLGLLAAAQYLSSIYVIDPELQTFIGVAVNLMLRQVTNSGIKTPLWYKKLAKGK